LNLFAEVEQGDQIKGIGQALAAGVEGEGAVQGGGPEVGVEGEFGGNW
jgi:hypothetical protein